MLSTLAGLIVVLIVGRFAWQIARGLPGILIGVVVAAGMAWYLRVHRNVVTSVFASGFGAAVASFLAISTSEVLAPGSTEWMLTGGLYGASTGLPLAFVLGTLGLIECRAVRSSAKVSEDAVAAESGRSHIP